MGKRSIELPMNMVIIAIILIIVLVLSIIIFVPKFNKGVDKVSEPLDSDNSFKNFTNEIIDKYSD